MSTQNLNPDEERNEPQASGVKPDSQPEGIEPAVNLPIENQPAKAQPIEARQAEARPTDRIDDASPKSGERDGEPISVERIADAAKEKAGVAADAFRRGEFIQDSAVDPGASRDDRLIGLLCYVIPFAMSMLVLLSESSGKRSFQRYHAVQSLGLNVIFAILSFAIFIGVIVIQIIPIIGHLVFFIACCLSPIAFLISVITMLYYGYQAYQGKRFVIPGLTSFLQEQGWLNY